MITCKIFSLLQNKVIEQISSLEIFWSNGEVGILPGHADFFAAVAQGKLTLSLVSGKLEIELNDATVNFDNATNTLIVLEK
jgi:F0F1-type ATP synthase epsilon subunit